MMMILKNTFPLIPYQDITIDNLLHHTSGIPEFLQWRQKEIDINQINYNKEFWQLLSGNKLPVNFKPGEQFFLFKYKLCIARIIVEKVSGMSFKDYMNKNIFKPLI